MDTAALWNLTPAGGNEPPQSRHAEQSTTLADWLDRCRRLIAAETQPGELCQYLPLTDAERQEAFEWTCKYGPGNCWTGTSGAAAMVIRRLLVEVDQLRAGGGKVEAA